ncbi:hypothetical protein ACFS4T_09750 [Pseudomonas lini]
MEVDGAPMNRGMLYMRGHQLAFGKKSAPTTSGLQPESVGGDPVSERFSNSFGGLQKKLEGFLQ